MYFLGLQKISKDIFFKDFFIFSAALVKYRFWCQKKKLVHLCDKFLLIEIGHAGYAKKLEDLMLISKMYVNMRQWQNATG
jgi:hypothetical protein